MQSSFSVQEPTEEKPLNSSSFAPRLVIVIPALNEEDAIGATIERTLAAREEIIQKSAVSDVEIVVVSDGSTDRTPEIAQSYKDVRTIVFEKNRGYGAAIKAGWDSSNAELLAFLDADGTCDPRFFAVLCDRVCNSTVSIALGSRLGPDSEMPKIRRFGNTLYALLLGFLCGRRISDTASGMRVIRRDALPSLYPLPDGLHFTPSMSAKALLGGLSIAEEPMSYSERIGDSKLHVMRDGLRFLNTIGHALFTLRPDKLIFGLAIAAIILLCLISANPFEYYLRNRQLEDWMIYRFTLSGGLAILIWTAILGVVLLDRIAELRPGRHSLDSFWSYLFRRLFNKWSCGILAFGFLLIGALFVREGLAELLTSGKVTMHWSRLIAGQTCLIFGGITGISALLFHVLDVWFQHDRSQV